MTILYHASLDIDHIVNVFSPKLPAATYHHEDVLTPRISLSTSIEGCLTGVPWGGRKLENIVFEFQEMTNEDMMLVFRVYEFDISSIKKENLITTEELLKHGLVMDANASHEVWVINQMLKPTKTYLVGLKNYSEEAQDVYSEEFYKLTEKDW